eukprot:2520812-Heterocapsa_arctica.AAC.1
MCIRDRDMCYTTDWSLQPQHHIIYFDNAICMTLLNDIWDSCPSAFSDLGATLLAIISIHTTFYQSFILSYYSAS